jgi:hypothetical protein
VSGNGLASFAHIWHPSPGLRGQAGILHRTLPVDSTLPHLKVVPKVDRKRINPAKKSTCYIIQRRSQYVYVPMNNLRSIINASVKIKEMSIDKFSISGLLSAM